METTTEDVIQEMIEDCESCINAAGGEDMVDVPTVLGECIGRLRRFKADAALLAEALAALQGLVDHYSGGLPNPLAEVVNVQRARAVLAKANG